MQEWNWNNIPPPLVESINYLVRSYESLETSVSSLIEKTTRQYQEHSSQIQTINDRIDTFHLEVSERLTESSASLNKKADMLRRDIDAAREAAASFTADTTEKFNKMTSYYGKAVTTLAVDLQAGDEAVKAAFEEQLAAAAQTAEEQFEASKA